MKITASPDITFCSRNFCENKECERNLKFINVSYPKNLSFGLFEDCQEFKGNKEIIEPDQDFIELGKQILEAAKIPKE